MRKDDQIWAGTAERPQDCSFGLTNSPMVSHHVQVLISLVSVDFRWISFWTIESSLRDIGII